MGQIPYSNRFSWFFPNQIPKFLWVKMTALCTTATHSGAGEHKSWVRLGQWHHFVFNFTVLFLLYMFHIYFYININIDIKACTRIIPVSVLSRKPVCCTLQHTGQVVGSPSTEDTSCGTASVLAAPTAAPGAGGPWRPRLGPCRSELHCQVPPHEHLALLLVKQKIPCWAMGLSWRSKLAVFPGRLKQ